MTPKPLTTARLDLLPCDTEMLRWTLLPPSDFASRLGRVVAPDWPPMHWDDAAVAWCIQKLSASPDEHCWRPWLIAIVGGPVVGTVGFKGPPDDLGVVEVGYGIVTSHWRRGLATEAAAALIAWVKEDPRVRSVCAHTLAGDPASSGVLRRIGFVHTRTLNDPADGLVDRYDLPPGPA